MTNNQYKCQVCGEMHQLQSLIQFPQPDLVNDILAGREKAQLDILSKGIVMINRTFAVVESLLSVKIVDDPDDDQLDMYVWVKVESKELLRAKQLFGREEAIVVFGTIMHPIPFYDKNDHLEVSFLIGQNQDTGEEFQVHALYGEHPLAVDFAEGITLAKLGLINSALLHSQSINEQGEK